MTDQLKLFESQPFVGLNEFSAHKINEYLRHCLVRMKTRESDVEGMWAGVKFGKAYGSGIFEGDVSVARMSGSYLCTDYRNVLEIEILERYVLCELCGSKIHPDDKTLESDKWGLVHEMCYVGFYEGLDN